MAPEKTFYIYGRNSVEEALKNRPDEIEKILIKNTLKPSAFFDVSKLAEDAGLQIQRVPGQKIYALLGRVNDQGFVAELSQIAYTEYYDWAGELRLNENPGVLFLNGIEDPHNFGAILRSAAASGISAVMVPSQKQSPVNATVFKTSAGTAGRIPIIRVHDIRQGIKDLKLTGFRIYAMDMDGSGSEKLWDTGLDQPSAFLIGNEGDGIPEDILKQCDQKIYIPMENKVESLNASVSASLICYEWKRRQS